MSSAFDRMSRSWFTKAPVKRSRRPARRLLQVESLESRQMMSVVPVGGETRAHPQVSTPQVTWRQTPKEVAMNENGSSVIVFSSPNTSTATDDGINQTGVWFRRVPANGDINQTVPVEVNTTKTGNQAFGSVAMFEDGSFVVVWGGNGANTAGRPSDLPAQGALDANGIFFRRYSASGTPIDAAERMVNTTVPTGVGTDPLQENPSVAVDENGTVIIVWTTREGSGTLNSQYNTYMRRFDFQSGAPIDSTEVQINTSTTQIERLPDVAANPDGDFIITWSAAPQGGGDYAVLGRYFSRGTTSATTGFGPVFTVSGGSTPNNLFAAVDMDDAGNFVSTYTLTANNDENVNDLTGNTEILFRRFSAPIGVAASPLPLDATDRVLTTTNAVIPGPQRFSRVSVVGSTGDFVIVWDGVGPGTIDFNGDPVAAETQATGGGVFGQRFMANGTQVGGMFRANTTLPGGQLLSGVAMRAREDSSPANHSIIIAWNGNGTQTGQVDNQGVFYQRFARQTVDVDFTLPGTNPIRYSVVTPQPTALDAAATVTAPNGFSFANILLTVSLSTTGTGANALNPALESLAIFDQGPGTDLIDVNGTNISYNNVVIGTFAFGVDPSDVTKLRLVITFNAQATTASVQALMRQIYYYHTTPPSNPVLTDRVTSWFFSDATNLTSDVLTKTIRFVDSNNPGGGGGGFRKRGFCTTCGLPSVNYATSLYNVLLERDGTTAEINSLAAALRNGYPPQNAVSNFVNSVEYRRWLIADSTNGFYIRYLGRQADEGGVQFWLNAMAHGVSENQVIAGMVGSAEFYTTQGGGSAAGFVEALYGNVLNRTASAAEINYHVARVNAGTARSDVAYGFLFSTEFQSILVREWYDHYLAQASIDNQKLNNALARFGAQNSWQNVQVYILTTHEAIPRPLILGS